MSAISANHNNREKAPPSRPEYRSEDEVEAFHERNNAIWGRDKCAEMAIANEVVLIVSNPWTGQMMTNEEFSTYIKQRQEANEATDVSSDTQPIEIADSIRMSASTICAKNTAQS